MLATQCARHRIETGRSHTFDPVSGWCQHGCGVREDGRITNKSGSILNSGPTYSPTELDIFRQQTAEAHARKA